MADNFERGTPKGEHHLKRIVKNINALDENYVNRNGSNCLIHTAHSAVLEDLLTFCRQSTSITGPCSLDVRRYW